LVHAAGILDDASITGQDRDRLRRVLAPKVLGALHLDEQTADQPLDFFLLFSSVAAVLGTPGQSNYAAANAFLDSLAGSRRGRGLRAISIAWGPWSDIGLAAERADRGARLLREGLGSLAPDRGLEILDKLLLGDCPPHVIAARLDVERWCGCHPAAKRSPILSRLRTPVASAGRAVHPSDDLRDRLRVAGPEALPSLLVDHLRKRAAEVLRLPPHRLKVDRPLKVLGFDSLMTLELRNRLEVDLGFRVPATALWNYPSIDLLASFLAAEMLQRAPISTPVQSDLAVASHSEAVASSSRSAGLENLLEEELAAVEQLLRGGD
jgi:acyl carrier protein